MTMWTTIETAFLTAQFTRVRTSFHPNIHHFSPFLGLHHMSSRHSVSNNTFSLSRIYLLVFSYVGLVMVCNGICQAISSYVFGRLVKYIGRIAVFSIAALINYGTIILMFLWEPEQSQMVVLFVIAGFWGIADAIWQTQVIGKKFRFHFNEFLLSLSLSATYTVLYSESDPSALAKYRLWKSVGFVVTYGVQKIIFVIASELFSSSPSSMPVTSQFDFHSFFYLFISPSAWYVTHLSKFICVRRTINKRNLLSVTHHDLLRFFHISLSLSRACACFK